MQFSNQKSMSTLVIQVFKKWFVPLYFFVLVIGMTVAQSWSLSQLSVPRWVLVCPLNTGLGVRCPTCGLGRSLYYAFLGEWNLSWSYHPGGLIAIVLGAVVCLATSVFSQHKLDAAMTRTSHLFATPLGRFSFVCAILAYVVWGTLRTFPS